MIYAYPEARPILARTPAVLDTMLRDLPSPWIEASSGPGDWSPYDVVGHLIAGDKTDWIPRSRIILDGGVEPFAPFDRFAQEHDSVGRTLPELLDEFAALRRANLEAFDAFDLSPANLRREGKHPAFGTVTLAQLLSTWVAHDLGHIAQIVRAMAGRYREDAGPWTAYLPILAPRPPSDR